MWTALKKFFSRSKNFSALFGDVLFETNPVTGQSETSSFQWRVKRGLDQKSFYIAVKMVPDGYAGPEGSATNYISFDLVTAEQIRADIDECIRVGRQFVSNETVSR
jgi:hypothetical protein